MKTACNVVEKQAFRVIGEKITTTNKKHAGRKAVPAQWEKFMKQKGQEALMPHSNQEPFGLFGISVYNTNTQDAYEFDHYIAVASTDEESETYEVYEVPAALWAIFPCTIDTIGKTEVQAITKWIPRAGYKPLNSGYMLGKMKSGAPDIEYYGEDGHVEVWVAVTKK